MYARTMFSLEERRPQVRPDMVVVLIGRMEPDMHVPTEGPRFVVDDKRRHLIGQAPCELDAVVDVLGETVALLQARVVE